MNINRDIIISDNELLEYGEIDNLSQKAESLLKHQKENWDLVKNNFNALNDVQIKKYDFSDYYIRTQFNPSRITSTSAKVDKKSIENRKCFLCPQNLPSNQKGIDYKNKYVILCNPFPIFKQHLTIPTYLHTPQNIEHVLDDFMELSKDLGDNFFVFYNGPQCGASAPDHLHFQAGLKNSTPLEENIKMLIEKYSTNIRIDSPVKVDIVQHDLAKFIYLQSSEKEIIKKEFNKLYDALKSLENINSEPMLNIICGNDNEVWQIFIFPREKHRPNQYFMDDNAKRLISPASVDMMGLLITPRIEDFEILTETEIKNIFSQVSFNDEKFRKVKLMISN
ncbi:MAG: DUF4922 domain-containing protein [Ignavibacteriales bacterium]|nr:DUF4922 domain-containing protein [Ignavibacteriales bacterium]